MDRLLTGIVVFWGLLGSAHAALHPAVNGQIYDDELGISWLEDAHMVRTLCEANDPLWVSWNESSKEFACQHDHGRLGYPLVDRWIAHLNENNYLGIHTWRLPATHQPDPTCSEQYTIGSQLVGLGANCLGSEMGYLFNVTLGNPNIEDGSNCYDFPETDPDHCLLNTGPFENLAPLFYYSGASPDLLPETDDAPRFHFRMDTGMQEENGIRGLATWPVHDGPPSIGFAHLESPTTGSSESGIGLIRGWACSADYIFVVIDGKTLLDLPYGSTRLDTLDACGDSDNGFGGVVNWNRIGNGEHEIRAYREGMVEFARATFNVTTLEREYLTGAAGRYIAYGFPDDQYDVLLRWSEAHQNFKFEGDHPTDGGPEDFQGDPTHLLESPQPGSFESGIGLIRGWACEAAGIHVVIDEDPAIQMSYGAERQDTVGACGDDDNGFGFVVNWNRYSAGTHRLRAYSEGAGAPFADVTFNVHPIGTEFLTGVGNPSLILKDFPDSGNDVTVTWSEPHQGVVITGFSGQ